MFSPHKKATLPVKIGRRGLHITFIWYKRSVLIAQAVAQAHQAVAQVDVLHHHIRVRNGQVVVGEIPEALDAQADQAAAQLLGTAAGQAENGHFGVMLGAERFQFVDVQDLHAADLLAHFVGGVIKGWTEALKMMPVGSKWELYIPQELAYGSRDMGQIKPFSTLIFEIELLDIEK